MTNKANVIQMHAAPPLEDVHFITEHVKLKEKISSGGDDNMKNYVTREELNHAVDRLSSKIDLSEAHTETKLANLEAKIENIPDKINLALSNHDKVQRQEHRETQRFLWGTIAIGGLSLIVTIISMFL